MDINNERLARTIVRKFGTTGIAEDDLFQEGMLALFKAEQTYNADLNVKFETYASTIIKNRIIDILRAKNTQPEDDSELVDFAVGKTLEDEVDLIEKGQLLETVLSECSETERAIFNAYFQGFSYDEICGIFGVTGKKIDNTIQKIKKRIKLENED